MSTVSVPKNSGGRAFAAVKGAPETIKRSLVHIPDSNDEIYTRFTMCATVCLLGLKEMDGIRMIGLSVLLANS